MRVGYFLLVAATIFVNCGAITTSSLVKMPSMASQEVNGANQRLLRGRTPVAEEERARNPLATLDDLFKLDDITNPKLLGTVAAKDKQNANMRALFARMSEHPEVKNTILANIVAGGEQSRLIKVRWLLNQVIKSDRKELSTAMKAKKTTT